MKKVFLTLAVVAAMAWGMSKIADAKCLTYTINCPHSTNWNTYTICVPGVDFMNLSDADWNNLMVVLVYHHCS